MEAFLQQVVNGLQTGSLYALATVGYSLIYSVLGFSNFAHGELMLVGAYVAYFMLAAKASIVVALAVGAAAAAIFAGVMERIAYRPLRVGQSPTIYYFVTATAFSIMTQNFTLATLSANFRRFPVNISSITYKVGPVYLGLVDVLILVSAAIALGALLFLIYRMPVGLAIRAVAQDSGAGALIGIDVNRVCTTVFLIAGALAGITGFFRGLLYTVHPLMGIAILKAFICAILGGLGSLPGAVAGAYLLGMIEAMVGGYITTVYRDIFSYGLMIAVLILRPQGLMGRVTTTKV